MAFGWQSAVINFFFPSFSLFAESHQEEWEAWEVVELEVVVILEEEEEEVVAWVVDMEVVAAEWEEEWEEEAVEEE